MSDPLYEGMKATEAQERSEGLTLQKQAEQDIVDAGSQVEPEVYDLPELYRKGYLIKPDSMLPNQYTKPGTKILGNWDTSDGLPVLHPNTPKVRVRDIDPEKQGLVEDPAVQREVMRRSMVVDVHGVSIPKGVLEDMDPDTKLKVEAAAYAAKQARLTVGGAATDAYDRMATTIDDLFDTELPKINMERPDDVGYAPVIRDVLSPIMEMSTFLGLLGKASVVKTAVAGAMTDFSYKPDENLTQFANAFFDLNIPTPADIEEIYGPLAGRTAMAVEGGLIGWALGETLKYGARGTLLTAEQLTRLPAGVRLKVKAMIDNADALEQQGIEQMRSARYALNSGLDPDGVVGMTKYYTAKMLKGAQKFTDIDDLDNGATREQKIEAFNQAAQLVQETSRRQLIEHAVYAREADEQFKKTATKVPEITPFEPFLTAREKKHLTTARARKLIEMSKYFDPEEMATVAAAGEAKRHWYKNSARALSDVFGVSDGRRFAAVLAATSPQTSVQSNLRNSLNFWKNWNAAGRPTEREAVLDILGESVEGTKGRESVLGAWINNTLRAVQASDPADITLSGPKVDSFMRNLQGQFDEVTNDTWMANYAGVSQQEFSGSMSVAGTDPGLMGGYLAANVRTREAADILSQRTGEQWTPAEIQETIWSWTKAAYELHNSPTDTGDSILQMIQSGQLTDDVIAETPDFFSLFKNPEYADILQEAGYGKQLEELRGGEAFGGAGREGSQAGKVAAGAPEQSRHIEAAARRLDSLYKSRRIAGDFRQYRIERSFEGTGEGGNWSRPERGSTGLRFEHLGTEAKGVRHTVSDAFKSTAQKYGMSTPDMFKLNKDTQSVASFHAAITAAKESQGPYGNAVYVYPKKDYRKMDLYLTEDGQAGFALKGDDIVSVFNTRGGNNPQAVQAMLQLAVESGGRRLDAFSNEHIILPRLYSMAGFKPVSRLKWDPAEAPPGWPAELGEPDVVFMVYDPGHEELFMTKGGAYAKDYDAAVAAQDKALK